MEAGQMDNTSKYSFLSFIEKPASENIASKKHLWDEIVAECEKDKNEVEAYIRSKKIDYEVVPDPLAYMNEVLFPLLLEAMVAMLHKIKDDDSFYRQKSTLDGIDYLCEYLFNMNPKYPERQENWTYIFDLDWVEQYLDENPRPYYPFHLVWSRDFAALKIQSYMRGYWARIRPDVLEVRNFWKAIKEDRELKEITASIHDVGSPNQSKQRLLPPLNL